MKKGFIIALLAIVATVGNVFSQSMIISAGYDHAVAICDKGQIYAWGRNSHNKLCLEDQTIGEVVSSPSRVKIDPNLTFSQVSAGSGGHNVALSCKSTVYCWGENNKEQCGRDGATYEYINDEPVPVYKGEVEQGYTLNGEASATGEYLGGVVYVCGTTNASMAILADGTAVWWGSNPLLGAGSTSTPKYIRDEDGQKLQNVVQIMGGDDNILIVVGDNPDDQVGTVYSAGQGTLNGRGGVEDKFAKPVEIAKDENGQRSSGEFLRNVRTTGIADNAAFAVDGTTGYVYGWGDNSWGCTATGANPRSAFKYAAKVASGEYESISGLPFLTDVKQVIGGNGTGAAITEEGYLLWWGTNDAGSGSGNSGGVVPNSDYATVGNTCETGGPVFANYCAGEKGPTEVRVDDAISIGRGDLASFMVNAEGKYYVWGASNIAGKNEFYGIMGTGIKNDLSTCLKEIILPCPSRDICPEAYMNGPKYKCPGIKDSLYCGFSPVDKVESGKNVKWRYFFRWFKDGNLLNSITEDDIEKLRLKSIAELEADIYNRPAIEIEEEGVYEVEILYIGTNVPCDNCPEAKAKIQVIDMLMPIDTVIKPICLGDPLAPTAAEIFNYEYKVNGDFYNATQLTTFAIFPTIDSNDTLGVYTAYGAGGIVDDIEITGDKIKEINLNGDKESNDTTYTVWAEDITRFETKLFENSTIPTGETGFTNSAAGNAQIIHLTTTSELLSFSLIVKAPDHGDASFTVTPKIYKTGKSEYGMYTAGELYKTGKTVGPITIPAGKLVDTVIKCNIILEANSVRGGDYILYAEPQKVGQTDIYWYTQTVAPDASLQYATPYEDSNHTGITATGAIVGFKEAPDQCQGGKVSPYFNITFGKMTDYTCGRIPLTARLECPPCNNPKKLEIISTSHTIKTDVDPKYKKVVELCKESNPLDLDIEPLVGQTDPNAKFDILWFDKDPQKNAIAAALEKDETGTVNTLLFSTDWATVAGATDITEDAEKVYYVYVHDHEKVGCPNYDSIKVIAHPVPADTLVWDTFCLTSRLDEPRFVASPLSNKDIHWVGDDPTVASVWASIIAPTTFDYTITDKVTTCVGETHSYTVTVNKTEDPDVETLISIIKEPGTKLQLLTSIRSVAEDCEIHWYTTETGSEEIKDVNLDEKGTLTVWAEQYNTVTECSSERIEVTIVINETPAPTPRNEHLCLGQDEIQDLREYVTAKDENHKIKIYDSQTETELKGEDLKFNPTAKGVYKFLASQSTMENGDEIESGKVPFEITVHEVATLKLDLPDNPTSYCINDTDNPPTELKFESNNDGDISGAMWSESPDMSNSVSSITPTNNISGTKTYYVRAEYDNDYADPNAGNASTVCLGKIQKIEITTNQTELPATKTDFKIQYLKEEGKANNQFKTLLSQTDTAVIVKDNKHKLVWYDKNHVELPSEPRPDYNENQQEDTEDYYYVRQYNTETGCYSEYQKVVVTISAFLKPTVKSIQLCQGDLDLVSDYILEAKINKGAKAESDFKLVWYTKDPNIYSDLTGESEIDLKKNADVMAFNANPDTPEKDFTFYVVQEYTGEGGGKSPREELTVSILSKPVLITKNPDPICKGTSVHLGNYYKISEQIPLRDYYTQLYGYSSVPYLGGDDQESGNLATKHGTYKARAFFMLNGKECTTRFEEINVTVQDLEVGIVGDDWTCPGRGVDLKAEIKKSEHMSTEDTPTYSWKVSPSGVTGFFETFNTSGNGLREGGESVSVSLEVSMGACKGKKAERNHVITVKDPGVSGKITFDEQNNTTNGSKTLPSVSNDNNLVSFDACNKKVDITFNVDQTEEEFTYENLNTGDKGVGTFSSGEGKFSLKAGTNGASYEGIYEVTYTNTCPTSFKFKITDRSLNVDGVAENWAVCEGEPLTITVVNFDNTPFHFDPRKYTIEWEKDDTPLPYKTEVLHIASTTPNDNGKYSFKITSSGCVYLRNIAAGLPFKSKPKVKIDSTRLEHNGVYEVVRTKSKEITLPFIQPDMSLYEEKIIWRENGKGVKADGKEVVGSKVNSNNEVIGQTLKFGEIKTDHDYQIIIAYGDRGYDNEICGTSLDLSVKVDALLSIKTKLIDSEGNETEDMCINEEGVGFLIDTTGTGSILHENDFSFKIYEDTGDGRKTEIKKEEKDGLLFAEITPNKSANYQIVYKYNVGNQDSTKTYSITVHPAYEVEWDKNVRVCDGSQSFIPITKAEPHNDIKLTWMPDETLGNGSISGASVTGIFSGDGLYTKKQLTLVASTIGGYCAPKEYHPEFIIDKRIEGEFIAPEFVCEGYSATLNASKFQADEYIWSSEEFGEGVTHSGVSIEVTPKTMYPSYSVAMKRGACTETADIDLTVKYAPEFDRIDSLTYRTIEVVIVPSTGTAPFQYIVDNEIDEYVMNAVKDGLEYGTHNIKVIDNAGCQLDTVITINPPALEFPIHVSPNGDGKNDKFSIPTLKDAYPDAKIKIFDRWGKKLAEYRAGDSDLDWDGTYKGSDMPSTDYWYEIEIKEIKKTYVGHFTLIRQ